MRGRRYDLGGADDRQTRVLCNGALFALHATGDSGCYTVSALRQAMVQEDLPGYVTGLEDRLDRASASGAWTEYDALRRELSAADAALARVRQAEEYPSFRAGLAAESRLKLRMGLWGGFAQKERTLLAGLTAFASLSILMAFVARFDVYLVLMALYGVALTTVQTTVSTLLQERSAPAMQGRVFGLMGAVYSGCMPLGMAVFGLLADRLPLRWLMAASGAALLLQVRMAAVGRPRRRA